MRKKAILALMMAAALMLSSCALVEKDLEVDRATEIIKVGDYVHTKGEVQRQVDSELNYMAYLYSMYGMSYDTKDSQHIADTQQSVIDSLVDHDVQLIEASKRGMDQLTEEEEAEVAQEAQTNWDSILSQVKSAYFADSELDEAALATECDLKAQELGYSLDMVTKEARESKIVTKLSDAVKGEITEADVTEDDVTAAFQKKVDGAMAEYANDASSFGNDVNSGNVIYYRPAGYRMVKQILVKFLDEDQAVMDDLQGKVDAAASRATAATTALTDLGVEDPDALAAQVTVTMADKAEEATATDLEATATDLAATPSDLEATASDLGVLTIATVTDISANFTEEVSDEVKAAAEELATARAEEAFYTEQLTAARTAAYANIKPEADSIIASLTDDNWDTVMAEKTEDPGMQGDSETAKNGYAVTTNMTGMDSAFTAAAMAIENVGGVSPATEGMYGYYIIKYVSEVPEGAVEMTDEMKADILAEVLTEKQDAHFNEELAKWREGLNIKIDKNALND